MARTSSLSLISASAFLRSVSCTVWVAMLASMFVTRNLQRDYGFGDAFNHRVKIVIGHLSALTSPIVLNAASL